MLGNDYSLRCVCEHICEPIASGDEASKGFLSWKSNKELGILILPWGKIIFFFFKKKGKKSGNKKYCVKKADLSFPVPWAACVGVIGALLEGSQSYSCTTLGWSAAPPASPLPWGPVPAATLGAGGTHCSAAPGPVPTLGKK